VPGDLPEQPPCRRQKVRPEGLKIGWFSSEYSTDTTRTKFLLTCQNKCLNLVFGNVKLKSEIKPVEPNPDETRQQLWKRRAKCSPRPLPQRDRP